MSRIETVILQAAVLGASPSRMAAAAVLRTEREAKAGQVVKMLDIWIERAMSRWWALTVICDAIFGVLETEVLRTQADLDWVRVAIKG